MLELENISVNFGEKQVLKKINLSINAGERVAIIGENGAGKTTLSKVINGLVKANEGRISYNGEEIQKKEVHERSRFIGYAFQNPDDQIFLDTVEKEVEFAPSVLNIPKKIKNDLIDNLLSLTNLDSYRKEHPYNLPYSIRKIVTLVATISANPEIVILDEPTAGQDIIGLRSIREVLGNFPEKTFIVVSHDMEFVSKNFSRIIVMNEGSVLCDGSPKEVFLNKELVQIAKIEQPFLFQLDT